MGHWGSPRGVGMLGTIRGHIGAGRECSNLGARRGIGSMRGHLGSPRGVGVHWGGKWTGTLTTLDPSPASKHSDWFPLGSDLPHQGQARAPVEGPITPTGFPWGVTYLAKAKQVTEMSSAGYYIHLELYFMIVCTFVSMPPHQIFLHAMKRHVIWTVISADQFMHILTLSI